jgi:GNAT superfamily N-acetyltransferase
MQQFEGEGATYVSDPVRGAAIWQAPSPTPPAAWAQIRIALRLAWMLGRSTGRAIALNEVMEANHYSEPHWYLAILGVEPESQGQGLGAKLIQPILDRCDSDRVDAYLESSKESNIPFYRRFGFELTGELQVPDGPTLWPMLRKPR